MWKLVASLLLVCCVLMTPSSAPAADFQIGGHGVFGNPWGLYIGAPVPAPRVYVCPPAYYVPAPIYVDPSPPVYVPAPIYSEPSPPVYIVPAPVLYVHPAHWNSWRVYSDGSWRRQWVEEHLGTDPYQPPPYRQ